MDNTPSIIPFQFDIPIERAKCNGIPVMGYGYSWVFSASPDLSDDTQLQ